MPSKLRTWTGSINTMGRGLLLSEEGSAWVAWRPGAGHVSRERSGEAEWLCPQPSPPGRRDQRKVVTPQAGSSQGCADSWPAAAGNAAEQWEHGAGGSQQQPRR